MKQLLFMAATLAATLACTACSDKDDEGENGGSSAEVKLVRRVNLTYDGSASPTAIQLEYDAQDRIVRYDSYTISYSGSSAIVTDSQSGTTYSCELNAAGYATKIIMNFSDGGRNRQIVDEHTYDKNGCLTQCKETATSYTDNYTYKWSDGNIAAIDGEYGGSFTYGSTPNVPINLDLFYLTDEYGCETSRPIGLLGFFGRQNKNLPTSYKDDGYEMSYKYELNADGTVARVTFGRVSMELFY